MERLRGNIAFGDQVVYHEVEGFLVVEAADNWYGGFRLPSWEPIQQGQTFRLLLEDGRSGPIIVVEIKPDVTEGNLIEFDGDGILE